MTAPARVVRIRLHAATLASAPDAAARAQWEHAAADALVEDDIAPAPEGGAAGPFVVELRFEGNVAAVALLDAADEERRAATYRWDLRPLRDLLDEYRALGRRLASLRGAGPAAQWESVDIAKRAVHDEAAALIVEALAALGLGLESARRFFTLLSLVRMVQDAGGHFSE
ncbi:MAG TPA: UPF0262 family protein [Myxococcota bacterium]|nr:UPF0262 family protein [Myxococcota bacterium]